MATWTARCALLSSIIELVSMVNAQGTYSHTPKPVTPSGASLPVDPSFAGFGIEPSNLFSFTGREKANELSVNLLQNLADYTGTPAHLRIGGNTQDNMIYDSSMSGFQLPLNKNPTVSSAAFPPDQYIFGPGYLKALDRFPAGTPVTYGLNLAYQNSDYATKINATASAVVSTLKNVNLTSFEIGNEVDLYTQNGFRNGTWDGPTYTQQWLDRAGIVNNNVLKPNNIRQNFFEPGCTASTIGTSFGIASLEANGIANPPNASTSTYVSQFNQHDYYYYIGVSKYQLNLDIFTDLSTTAAQFSAWEEQIGEAHSSGYKYALREMGVVGPIGMHGTTDIFAASLWTLHFFLYAATLNISSVQMHMTDNSNASAWQPVFKYGNQPFVRPNYYAWTAMAQLNGCGGGMSVAGPGVISTGLPDGYANRVATYDIYRNDGALSSMVVINSKIVNAATAVKPSLNVQLSLPNFAGQDLYLSYLTADGADSEHNATWNGISYEQNAVGKPSTVNDTVQTVTVGSDGSASIPLRDSQAVVINIGSQIGSKDACPVNNNQRGSNANPTSSASGGFAEATGTDSQPQATASINSGPASAQQKSGAARLSFSKHSLLPLIGANSASISSCMLVVVLLSLII